MSLYWVVTIGLSLIVLGLVIAITILGSNYGKLYDIDGRLENIQEKLYYLNADVEKIEANTSQHGPSGYM